MPAVGGLDAAAALAVVMRPATSNFSGVRRQRVQGKGGEAEALELGSAVVREAGSDDESIWRENDAYKFKFGGNGASDTSHRARIFSHGASNVAQHAVIVAPHAVIVAQHARTFHHGATNITQPAIISAHSVTFASHKCNDGCQ